MTDLPAPDNTFLRGRYGERWMTVRHAEGVWELHGQTVRAPDEWKPMDMGGLE